MAHPDYVPPGMKFENGIFKPLATDNLNELQKLYSLACAERDNHKEEVEDLKEKIQIIYQQGAPPILREENATLKKENEALRAELEEVSKRAEKKARLTEK